MLGMTEKQVKIGTRRTIMALAIYFGIFVAGTMWLFLYLIS